MGAKTVSGFNFRFVAPVTKVYTSRLSLDVYGITESSGRIASPDLATEGRKFAEGPKGLGSFVQRENDTQTMVCQRFVS